jgi:hypothetical protein
VGWCESGCGVMKASIINFLQMIKNSNDLLLGLMKKMMRILSLHVMKINCPAFYKLQGVTWSIPAAINVKQSLRTVAEQLEKWYSILPGAEKALGEICITGEKK